jgi:hypothetical protein
MLMTDLRLLGVAMRNRAVAHVINQLRRPKRFGLALAIVCGLMMFGAKAEEYYYNPFFRAKLVFLALIAIHAALFRGSVYRRAVEMDKTQRLPRRARVAAALSLLLWIGVICMGRGIGYIEPPWASTRVFIPGSLCSTKVSPSPKRPQARVGALQPAF